MKLPTLSQMDRGKGWAPTSLGERLVSAAVELTMVDGWSQVTMGALAAQVGVSRQTVYNEVGTKSALAEAMILSESTQFLAVVTTALDDHPGDIVAAIESATRAVLEHAEDNQMLHAVVSATHGADTELLPLLTTHSAALFKESKSVITERVGVYRLGLTPTELDSAIDLIVRVLLSHVMAPSGTPARTAADLALITSRVLAS